MKRYSDMKAITKRAVQHYLSEKEMFKNRPLDRYQVAESGHVWEDYRKNCSTVRTKMEDRQAFEGQYQFCEIICNNVSNGVHIGDDIPNNPLEDLLISVKFVPKGPINGKSAINHYMRT